VLRLHLFCVGLHSKDRQLFFALQRSAHTKDVSAAIRPPIPPVPHPGKSPASTSYPGAHGSTSSICRLQNWKSTYGLPVGCASVLRLHFFFAWDSTQKINNLLFDCKDLRRPEMCRMQFCRQYHQFPTQANRLLRDHILGRMA